jgi:hypothetical protein
MERDGGKDWVFTIEDPRTDGFNGPQSILEGAIYEDDLADSPWDEDLETSGQCLGQNMNNPKHFRVFRDSCDLEPAGFRLAGGSACPFPHWSNYIEATRV